jgi:hypothetical protein
MARSLPAIHEIDRRSAATQEVAAMTAELLPVMA